MRTCRLMMTAALLVAACAEAGNPGIDPADQPEPADATTGPADARVWQSADAMEPPVFDAAPIPDGRVDAFVPPPSDAMSVPDASPSSDAGSGGMCSHSPCDLGGPLSPSCDTCVEAVCNLDFYCCLVEWDVSCKNAYSCSCN